jgi:colanic acid biosynthesis glycosyl transferase WcaI
MLSVIAALVVRIRGGRLINWLQDLFPELAIAAGLGWSKGVVGRTLAKIRDWSLRCAAQNVAIGDRMREALLARGIAAKQVTVIPNWADGESIRPVLPSDNRLRSAWGLEGKFVVGYSGNLGRAHEIDTLLGAMEILKSRSDIRFVFIGAGKQRQKLESECKNNGLMSVTFLPYQAREDLIWSLGVPDVHLVSLLPEMEGFVVPSKFYGIASAGRPTLFIGDLDGEIATALRQFDCGIAIRQGDAAGLAQAILRLQSDETLTAKLGANARKAFEAHWAKQIAFRAWVDTIERALKP